MFIGDLWDGRLLLALHKFRSLGESGGSEVAAALPRRPDQDSTPPTLPINLDFQPADSERPPLAKCSLTKMFFEHQVDNTPAAEEPLAQDERRYWHQGAIQSGRTHTHSSRPIVIRASGFKFDKKPPAQHFAEGIHSEADRGIAAASLLPSLGDGEEPDDKEKEEYESYLDGLESTVVTTSTCGASRPVADPHSQRFALDNPDVRRALDEEGETLPWNHEVINLGPKRQAELGREQPLEPWQLDMVDAIDQRVSVVVEAPTSAGKSWAAEYAALRVLRDEKDQDGVVVYVLPTNALANQQYASLRVLLASQGISKDLVKIFTSDRGRPQLGYRILVTNPQCLEITLLSPQLLNHDRPLHHRLRWVVFDEVHNISAGDSGGETSGKVLERLLCSTRCPVFCLSATLANGPSLLAWLRNIKAGQQTLHPEEKAALSGAAGLQGAQADPQPGSELVRFIQHRDRATFLHFYGLQVETCEKEVSNDGCFAEIEHDPLDR